VTIIEQSPRGNGCGACKDGDAGLFPFTMAFQPIVDISRQTIFAYEALVRGPNGESAFSVLQQVNEENRYAFDQGCRVKAIALAGRLGVPERGARLSVNFMPGAVYSPQACIQQTLKAARENNFPLDSLIFEIIEDEKVRDPLHLQSIITEYRKHGFALALDDFGAGYSGLNLLSELAVDIVKLDAKLARNIHLKPRSQAIVRSLASLCKELSIQLVGECVETVEEYETLVQCGITLMQGYLFAKPMFEGLPEIHWVGDSSQQSHETQLIAA
jgi:EAL domain-containing protein (putative c-di-GMP-specific phosphodiesterase class I)